ncbi:MULTISPECIES: hypothetical protein [Streptomyces]|uniref:hypothetical protein n=1 Tax=Streptomyces TaxID=1883 RepID=UPI0004CC5EC2|nr:MULTISPECIES: hypothetical protein [Streptomyces]KWT59384.1 hypothetical protein ADL21_24825 [Streptomyces albus subsp. albus]KOT63566.1 hypothetical protein ADK43_07895 [Streptomyces rimosus subsp. rimosus]KOT82596.1 hypothetical protein ADK70_24570 [Streptomyces rimosus subsp. pseudoverticillatus]KOT97538.1 hypothetical protein ADK86_16705 [Streptomyces sp. NRRL F-5755]RSO03597.1 hypothetical protein DMH18_37180 [Streptomyces sp. WAC 06783]
MPNTSVLLAAAAETSKNDGPGWVLRTVLIVGILGAVFLAWVLLRNYGKDDRDGNGDDRR